MSNFKHWFIQVVLFSFYFAISYNLALPNVVLSGVIALLLVCVFTNANRINSLQDGVINSFQLNDELHREKNQIIEELEEKIMELESRLGALDNRVFDLELPESDAFDEYNYEK